ncbi:hypothetical protein D3C83_50300 [compost metagenome]
MLAHVGVRILALGQEQELQLLAVGEEREAVFQRAPRGAPARVVAVEAEHDLVGLPQQLLHV